MLPPGIYQEPMNVQRDYLLHIVNHYRENEDVTAQKMMESRIQKMKANYARQDESLFTIAGYANT